MIATPERITLIGFNPFFQARVNTIAQAIAPPMKAEKFIKNIVFGKSIITIRAVTLAPEETPVSPGSASGFFITA